MTKPFSFNPHPDSTKLAVLLHGFSEGAGAMAEVAQALRDSPHGAHTDVFAPELSLGLMSRISPHAVIATLLQDLDDVWQRRAALGSPYDEVIFVGHSMGSLFARKLYLAAMGEDRAAPFEEELRKILAERNRAPVSTARPWGVATTRIISLAGMNRGWVISHHMSLLRGAGMTLGVTAGLLMQALGARPFVIMAARRGAPFVTQLRLQWIALRARASANGFRLAHVVQMLGTQDDLVPPSANIDPVTGADFSYVEVPRSGHANVVQMGDAHGEPGRVRRAAFLKALVMEAGMTAATPLAVSQAPPPDPTVTDVVFVMHGIRDLGYWTEKIGLRIAARAAALPGNRRIALETSTYGYFPLLSFLRPGARQSKVEWLMDRVTQAKARYPRAQFSYIGHSHGTYLIAKAIKDYPAVSFRHVVLAGSVLRTDLNWQDLFAAGRIRRALNFTASADWVVAFFPNAMQRIQWQDVGGAGHYGFPFTGGELVQLPPPDRHVVGGHSAALDEGWWDSIADFVLHGEFHPAEMPTSSAHRWWVAFGAAVAPVIWLLLASALAAGLFGLLSWDVREWVKTVAVGAYLLLIWIVLTRF